MAFFPLAKFAAKLLTESQNNDLRRYFEIASCDQRNSGKCFPGLLTQIETEAPDYHSALYKKSGRPQILVSKIVNKVAPASIATLSICLNC